MYARSAALAIVLGLVGMLGAGASMPVRAQAPAEAEPRVPARDLLPRGTRLAGQGWRVESPVQLESHLGRFVFRTEWGDLEAHGSDIASERIAEMPVIPKLDAISRVDVFANALATSAQRTGEAVVRVVTDPVGTIEGIPSGIARLARRTARTVRNVATTVGDAVTRPAGGDGPAKDGEDGAGSDAIVDFGKELAGVNRARRELAEELGIDPYTRNPLIQERLERLAWASVAGGFSMKAALGQVGGLAGDALSVTTRLDDLVWRASPAEIRDVLERRLVARGIEPRAARDFLRNGAFTPTQQVAFVEALEALGATRGDADLIALATGIRGEAHARFLVQQLRMLKRHLGRGDAVSELVALEHGVAAQTRNGQYLITLPVDRLSWTEDLRAVSVEAGSLPRNRRVIVAGPVSPLARRELARAGFAVVANAGRA
jgi:hypothetical protein